MGPLQYMVVGYERHQFKFSVLTELLNLTRKRTVRVIDAVVVWRAANGRVSSEELSEAVPESKAVLSDPTEEWFTQDDIDLVAENLPVGASVALLLLEHTWAGKLEEIAARANEALARDGVPGTDLAAEVERLPAVGPRQYVH